MNEFNTNKSELTIFHHATLFALSRCPQRRPSAVKSSLRKKGNMVYKSISSEIFTEKQFGEKGNHGLQERRLTVSHLSFSTQCFPRQPIWDTQPKPPKPSPWRFPRDASVSYSVTCFLSKLCQNVGLFWNTGVFAAFGRWIQVHGQI